MLHQIKFKLKNQSQQQCKLIQFELINDLNSDAAALNFATNSSN